MRNIIEKIWIILAINGALAILLVAGLALLFFWFPATAFTVLIVILAAYFIVEGLISIFLGLRSGWHYLTFAGILGAILGIGLLFWTAPTLIGLIYAVAAWSIAVGVMRVFAAISLRKLVYNESLLWINGVLTIVLGILLVFFPLAGLLAFLVVVAVYALLAGVSLIVLGLRLRRLSKNMPPI